MVLIVGLGNPGKEFEGTRHNAGFMMLARLREQAQIAKRKAQNSPWEFKKSAALEAEVLKFNNLILAKPQTMMNESGRAVRKLAARYKVAGEKLWVIHDDLDYPLGKFVIQFGRGAAGHRGVESIIKELGTKDFWRVRIGIGRPEEEQDPNDYVVGQFLPEEREALGDAIERIAAQLLPQWRGGDALRASPGRNYAVNSPHNQIIL